MNKKHSYFNLDETLKKAVEHFADLDPGKIAHNAGVDLIKKDQTFAVPFINQNYLVHHPSGQVMTAKGETASVYLIIIILHYLITADGTPLAGQWIAYRHLPGGDIYSEPFQKRAVTPFLKVFGDRPEEFKKAAEALGGSPLVLSGISMVVPVLPRVPICFTIWPGDEEMPASANILFDRSAHSYPPTEDYAHLPAIVTGAMKERMRL
ncbi:MAG: DUF3786 domain-containing protein [Clostridia bacterium]|nr:DUF3786 domain-containing protein [Clostridia bacterium]